MKRTLPTINLLQPARRQLIKSRLAGVCLLSLSSMTACMADFQNLGFEAGPVYFPTINAYYLTYPDVLPYWTVRFGSTVQAGASCNIFTLDSPAVALMSQGGVLGPNYVISGSRSVFLQSTAYSGDPSSAVNVSISQVGTIPAGTRSLVFDARNPWYGPFGNGFPIPPGPFNVTLNGAILPLIELTTDGGANITFGADVSAWAGQTAELSIGVLASPAPALSSWEGWAAVDSIRFSSVSVPEPTALSLLGLGLFGLFIRYWRRQGPA